MLDGVTGFVRDNVDELGPLIERLGEIDREACRRHVARYFSSAALAHRYEPMLADITARPRNHRFPAKVAPMIFRPPIPEPGPTAAVWATSRAERVRAMPQR
nr:hypothetical protein [Pseudonocardia sp. TRM90224]